MSTSSIQLPKKQLLPKAGNLLAITNGKTHSTRVVPRLFDNLGHEPMNTVHAIVVHQTDSSTAKSTLDGYTSDMKLPPTEKRKGVGAHFLIDKDGTIYQTADLSKRCRHVGPIRSKCYELHTCAPAQMKLYDSMSRLRPYSSMFVSPVDRIERTEKEYPDRFPSNADSIGIELVGKHLGDEKSQVYEKPTDEQQASLKWLVSQLLDAYDLKRTDVYRHPQISRKNEGEAKDATW